MTDFTKTESERNLKAEEVRKKCLITAGKPEISLIRNGYCAARDTRFQSPAGRSAHHDVSFGRQKRIPAAALAFLLSLTLLSPAIAVRAESDLSPENPAAAVPSQISGPIAGASETSSITVLLNGEPVSFDVQPEILAGTTFVSLRSIFEQLGVEVEWNQQRQEALLTSSREEICLKVGSKVAIRNTEVSSLTDAPYLKEDRVMVPLRYLSESLGYDVTWNPETRTAEIRSSQSGSQEETSGSSSEDSGENTAEDTSFSAEKPSSFGEGRAFSILGEAAEITCNEAIQDGLQESSACKGARLSLRQTAQQMEEFYDLYTYNYTVAIMQTRKDLNLLNDWSERNVVVTEEQTAYSIVNAMNEISLKQVEVESVKEALAQAEKTCETDRLRYEAGAISRRELIESEAAVETAEQQIHTKETELQGLYLSFYGTIGEEDLSALKEGTFPELEFHLNYEPVGEIDIEAAFRKAKQNDPYLWYLKNSMDNADFKLQSYEYNVGGKSYELTQMDLTRARINYNATEANLKTTMESRYNQLLQLENQIASLESQEETLRRSIDTMRTLYEAGVQPRSALEEVLQNRQSIEDSLLSLKVSHSQLRELFEKPYLAPEYMVSE